MTLEVMAFFKWCLLLMAKSYRGACQKFCSAKRADSVRVKLPAGRKAQKGKTKLIHQGESEPPRKHATAA